MRDSYRGCAVQLATDCCVPELLCSSLVKAVVGDLRLVRAVLATDGIMTDSQRLGRTSGVGECGQAVCQRVY